MIKIEDFIDHTILKPTATENDIKKVIQEAVLYNFRSVCIHPCFLNLANEILINKQPYPITVIGFPLGANTTETKVYETKQALKNGAIEIDMVMNISDFKSKNFKKVLYDISSVVKAADPYLVKVTIETAYLTNDEKIKAVELIINAGAAFVKTSTGFAPFGATIEDIQLLKKASKGKIKIKASGGIKTRKDALILIDAGADRIGASTSVNLFIDN